MRFRSAPVVVVVLVAGLVVLAAGCGGGKKSTPQQGPAATHTSTQSSTGTTKTSGGSSSTPSFASAKNCQDLAGIAAKAVSAITATSGTGDLLKTESKEIQGLANAAPSDIRSDFQTLAAAFSGFLNAIEKSGYKLGSTTPPTAAQAQALQKAEASFSSPKLKKAENHLDAWTKQNCKGVHLPGQ